MGAGLSEMANRRSEFVDLQDIILDHPAALEHINWINWRIWRDFPDAVVPVKTTDWFFPMACKFLNTFYYLATKKTEWIPVHLLSGRKDVSWQAATSFEHLNQLFVNSEVVVLLIEGVGNVNKVIRTGICEMKTATLALSQQMNGRSLIQIFESSKIIGSVVVRRVCLIDVLGVNNYLLALNTQEIGWLIESRITGNIDLCVSIRQTFNKTGSGIAIWVYQPVTFVFRDSIKIWGRRSAIKLHMTIRSRQRGSTT